MNDEPPVIQPPASLTVDHERKPVLYLADGTPLVRRAGFSTQPQPAPLPYRIDETLVINPRLALKVIS